MIQSEIYIENCQIQVVDLCSLLSRTRVWSECWLAKRKNEEKNMIMD